MHNSRLTTNYKHDNTILYILFPDLGNTMLHLKRKHEAELTLLRDQLRDLQGSAESLRRERDENEVRLQELDTFIDQVRVHARACVLACVLACACLCVRSG